MLPSGATGAFQRDLGLAWEHEVVDRIKELLELKQGWDTYDGQPVDPSTAVYALKLLSRVRTAMTPEPTVVPLSNGGLQFEWSINHSRLEIAVYAPYDSEVIEIPAAAPPVISPVYANVDELARIMKRLFG
jgi:hypothetical protein